MCFAPLRAALAVLILAAANVRAEPPAGQPSRAAQCDPPSTTFQAPCDAPRGWLSAEYLLWWVRDASLPIPLATSGSLLDDVPGALGQPGTRVLYGGADDDFGMFNGMRFSGGLWGQRGLGIEASGFLLERRSTGFSTQSDLSGTPLLGRPFFNPLEDAENNFIDSIPGAVAGAIDVTSSLRLWGWEASAAAALPGNGSVFLGYRTLDLRETLQLSDTLFALVDDTITFRGAFVDAGSVVADFDRFGTHNRFHGVQLGGRYEWCRGILTLGVLGKVGLGWTRQTVRIEGASALLSPGGGVALAPGGLLAQTTNIGHYTDDDFAVVPELGVHANLQLTPRLRARLGYNFLYWSSVVRPGDQIDRVVNPRLAPTAQDFTVPAGLPRRPAFSFERSDFWAHGVDLGFELTF